MLEYSIICKIMHEIRLPLYNIKSIASIISNMAENQNVSLEALAEYAKSIQQSCSAVSHITSNLHDLTHGTLEESNVFCQCRILNDFLKTYEISVEAFVKRANGILTIINNSSSEKFVTDYEKLARIFNNLVTNALKYNNKPLKQVVITVSDWNDGVIFAVSDDGIGIPKDEIAFVTACAYRASNVDKFYVDGCGLGLNIVDGLVKCMGGELKIESELGKGTTASVKLPGLIATDFNETDAELYSLNKTVLEDYFSSINLPI